MNTAEATAITSAKPITAPSPIQHRPVQQVTRVHGDRIKLAENARQYWHVRAPVEHDPEVCCEPGYLWHRHDRMRPGDRVEITNDLFQYLIELIIVRIDRDTQSVQTRIIAANDWRDKPLEHSDLSAATIEKRGADQWRIMLNGVVLSRGHASKAEAEEWLEKRRNVKGK